MRILLFDVVAGGHHEVHVNRFSSALEPMFEVVAAVPRQAVPLIEPPSGGVLTLDPRVNATRWETHGASSVPSRIREEIRLLNGAVARARPDHVIHMYADRIAAGLALGAGPSVPTTLYVFRPRAHYESAFGTRLSMRERVTAHAHDRAIARWRRTSSAHAVLTLDREAVRRWAGDGGASVHWVPDPPVRGAPGDRRPLPATDVAMYGRLAPRKGVHLLAEALAASPTELSVTLAGSVREENQDYVRRAAARMAAAGASVALHTAFLPEEAALSLLSRARCVALPYARHIGFSRVLLEASTVGSPVVAHRTGLLGHLVEEHNLGITTDCTDASRFRADLDALLSEGDPAPRFAADLRRFSAMFSEERFRAAVRAPFAAPRWPGAVSAPTA